MQQHNIDDAVRQAIITVAAQYGCIKKIVLFGSRARGDNTERSDVDLAIYLSTPDPLSVAQFCSDVEEIDTLLKFDIVVVDNDLKPMMLDNISKDGVTLMGKFAEKLKDYVSAVGRLQESLQEYEVTGSSSVRDGAIQRFEFCSELAWKTAREYLIDEGFMGLNSPKAVLKQAYANGLISNEQVWVQMLSDRNVTSHMYKEELARQIYGRICLSHYDELMALANRLSV